MIYFVFLNNQFIVNLTIMIKKKINFIPKKTKIGICFSMIKYQMKLKW